MSLLVWKKDLGVGVGGNCNYLHISCVFAWKLVCVCVCVCVCTCVCVCVCVYVCVCAHVYTCVHVSVYRWVCLCVSLYVLMQLSDSEKNIPKQKSFSSCYMLIFAGLQDYSPFLALQTVLDFWNSIEVNRFRKYAYTLAKYAGTLWFSSFTKAGMKLFKRGKHGKNSMIISQSTLRKSRNKDKRPWNDTCGSNACVIIFFNSWSVMHINNASP